MWDTISIVVNLVFQLFMIFIIVYSAMAIFSLLRFGRSPVLGFIVSAFYITVISSLYFQTLSLISGL